MFFLLPILLFAALAVNSLASPYAGWPLRARNEVSSRTRRAEFKIHSRAESSHRNFSLPLPHQEKSDTSLVDKEPDRTPSPLSPRDFDFPLEARDEDEVYNSTTTSTGPIRPKNAFAFRPSIRPRKSESLSSGLIQHLTTRQSDDSSDEPLNETVIEPGSSLPGLTATIPNTPGFNATVLSPNGTDITSNFKIMFYRAPKVVALDELNGKARKDRRTGPGERPQNKCDSPTASFHYSHCTPKGSTSGTTRTFQVWCRERSHTVQYPHRPIRRPPTEPGARGKKYVVSTNNQKPRADPPGICGEDEVCMDSHMSWVDPSNPHQAMYTVARCVSTRIFKQLPSANDLRTLGKASGDIAGWSMDDLAALGGGDSEIGSSSNNQGASSSNQDLAGSMMSVRLSTLDERPLPATVEVDSGQASTDGREGSIESHPCREPCLEVSTSDFPVNTNWVSAHARLVSTLAVAGVMWVALFH